MKPKQRSSIATVLLLALAGCAGPPAAAPPPEPAPRPDARADPGLSGVPAPGPEATPVPAPEPPRDSLLVAGAEERLPCRVLRLEAGTIEIALDRAHLTLLARGESPGAAFPDAVLARELRVVLRCRILEEEPDRVVVAFPWDQVERLERGPREAGAAGRGERAGSLAGVVLARGKPLAGARLRVVRLSGRTLIPGVLEAPPAMEGALESVTGEDGRFLLEAVPPGSYKVWVKPRGEEAWLRRATMIPDVYVPAGERAELSGFDIRVVGGS